MAIFIIGARANSPELASGIARAFPNEHFQFSDTIWIVNTSNTAKQICDAIGVKKGGITGVFAMQGTPSYYGVANPALWDWLRSAIERSSDG